MFSLCLHECFRLSYMPDFLADGKWPNYTSCIQAAVSSLSVLASWSTVNRNTYYVFDATSLIDAHGLISVFGIYVAFKGIFVAGTNGNSMHFVDYVSDMCISVVSICRVQYCEMYAWQCFWSHFWLHWVHMKCIYWNSFWISSHELIFICGICVAFEGHICCWDIYGNSMVKRSCF